ncbi:MAG: hypothetical protein HN356_11570 [Calditrichaeota bacterium]|nr:hypothetical protein [Calditrichota bacterium]
MENLKIKRHNINEQFVDQLASKYGLPLHVYFPDKILQNVESFRAVSKELYPESQFNFAVKSNPSRGALRAASKFKLAADVSSEFELRAALGEGIPGENLVCNGCGKTDRYLRTGVDAGVLFAADSFEELDLLNSEAKFQSKSARVMIRFVGMPLKGFSSLDQSTAADWTKFGIDIKDAKKVFAFVKERSCLQFEGLSAHIGTQVCNPKGYKVLIDNMLSIVEIAKNQGLTVRAIDLGGGYPESYLSEEDWDGFTSNLIQQIDGKLSDEESVTWNKDPMGFAHLKSGETRKNPQWIGKAYRTENPGSEMFRYILTHKVKSGERLCDYLKKIGSPRIILEPGRAFFGTSGITITEVMGVKYINDNPVVFVDMGVNNHGTNLVAPDIFPFEVIPKKGNDSNVGVFIGGRLCYTGDMISKVKVKLNRLPVRGEKMIIHNTGSYCADHFASNHCGFARPAKVAIWNDGKVEVWRKGEEFSDVFGEIETSQSK